MVGDAQVIPIFMPSGEDVEISAAPIDLGLIPSRPSSQQGDLPCPGFPAGAISEDTGVFHGQCLPVLLSKILAADGSQDDLRVDHFLLHLRPQRQRVSHQVVH